MWMQNGVPAEGARPNVVLARNNITQTKRRALCLTCTGLIMMKIDCRTGSRKSKPLSSLVASELPAGHCQVHPRVAAQGDGETGDVTSAPQAG